MSGPHMGQDLEDLSFLSDSIQDLLKEVPTDLLGKYDAEYNQCLSYMDAGILGIPKGLRCLRDLYSDLQDLVKNGETPTTTPTTTPATRPPPPPSEFPWIPVTIAVAGGGILIYFLTRGK